MGFFKKLLGKEDGLDYDRDVLGSPNMNMNNMNMNNPLSSPDQDFFSQTSQGMPPMGQMGSDSAPQISGQYPPGQSPYGTGAGTRPKEFSPEEFGYEKDTSRDRGSFSPLKDQSVAQINLGKDLEIISAKLDAIKAELDSVNQRMKRLERLAEGAEQPRDKWSY